MTVSRLLIANRGEIAVRIARAAAELDVETVAVHSEDDAAALHTVRTDESHALAGLGAAAYLDIDQIVDAAVGTGCDAVHPGYGFLSENAELARRCRDAGLIFVGPSVETLELFGDKIRARAVAKEAGVEVLAGTLAPTSLDEARAFCDGLNGAAMMVKAVSGGGGRGMRVVRSADELDEAFERCASEAKAAFGSDELYVEKLVERARHIEVQIAGDGEAVTHLGERDCSVQRRHQKILEIAPAPALDDSLRARIHTAAVSVASSVSYENLGTFEFLVEADPGTDGFAFIEANARLQVEHTVTEEVTGVDLVQAQLLLAQGTPLTGIEGLDPRSSASPRGFAIQARVNMETMKPDGTTKPSGGVLSVFEPPAGPGTRVDSFGYAGYATSPRYDSLLAKVIVHHPSSDWALARRRLERALGELRIEGVETNSGFLRALLRHDEVVEARLHTRLVDEHMEDLVAASDNGRAGLFFAADSEADSGADAEVAKAGVEVDSVDPLAVLTYGKETSAGEARSAVAPVPAPEGTTVVTSPVQGTIVSIEVAAGDRVREGALLLVMDSMKMEHEVRAPSSGTVERIAVAVGDTLYENQPLVYVEEGEVEGSVDGETEDADLDFIRPDLERVLHRRSYAFDENRPEAVDKRARLGYRTARANVEDLVDDGTFLEYGPLVIAAQRRRRTLEDLIERTPTDGMVTGVGAINGELFDEPASRCAVLAYDYTVLAGTQGTQNHRKTDRMIFVARRDRMPLVIFCEGGGGRPGDTDKAVGGPGDTVTFAHFAQLSGLVPLVGITNGRCFAGNASLLGCCDVIIATEGSNIGMGGPAMIEGGGLGVFAPEDIGPMSVQVPNGVVDIVAKDEADAVVLAKQYLSYFQGNADEWEAPDQRPMRRIVPENRLRVYDVREVIGTLADEGSVLELRRGFGHGMITSLIRVEGRPLGICANNPVHLGGAIDSDGADKGARFLQLCDAFDIPVLFLCDTPGIMVGPEAEKTALVRHANRMFLIGANLSVPFFTVVLRKAYGLGAIAMGGGGYKEPSFTVSWPTGEFGGMGLEGSVKLGYRRELAAIEDPDERRAKYEEMVAKAYETGAGLNQASQFGVDDTIDPAETRAWVAGSLRSVRPRPPRDGKKRAAVDGW